MKTLKILSIIALSIVLFSCNTNNKDNNDPEPPANVQHGNIGDVICVNGYYYKITNNFEPYSVELERDGYTAPSTAPRRANSQASTDGAYEGDVVIPSSIEYDGVKFSVTSIGESAFYNKNVKSVYIPSCVEKVGFNAFRMCYNMEKITISYGVKKIEPYAFSGCRKCTSLLIPGSVEEIGNNAFEDCYQWTKLEIESGVKKIGYAAFMRRNYPTTKSNVYCYAVEPPEIGKMGNSCAAFTVTNCNLNVPKEAKSVYLRTQGWMSFSTIYGF